MPMKNKANQQIQISRVKKKDFYKLSEQLFNNCCIDQISGRLNCLKCDNLINVNLSERIVFCSVYGMLIEEEGYGILV